MKLRNKKTGKHGEYKVISAGYLIRVKDCNSDEAWQYDCLAGFNEEWEDYKSAEPLIEDEKIRKAVRAWAEANSQLTSVVYQQLDKTHSCISFIDFGGLEIEFNRTIDELTSGKIYGFEELCGEEEE